MYLDSFVADGRLDAAGAERLCWEAAKHSATIILVVDGRRVLAHNVPLCWDTLAIKSGTVVAVEVTASSAKATDAQQQAAIAGFVDVFVAELARSAAAEPEPAGARGGLRFVPMVGLFRRGRASSTR